MLKEILLAGTGGFIGTSLRYMAQIGAGIIFETPFPKATMLINIIGSLIIGIVFALFDKTAIMSQETKLFLATGICGGFTTFSAFSYDILSLMKQGMHLSAIMYVLISVIFGIIAAYAGYAAVR